MKKRVITGVCYVVIMAALLVMKLLIPVTEEGLDFGAIGVDVLFFVIAAVGAYEFTRAFGERKKITDENGETRLTEGISTVQRWVAIVTCALLVPAFSVAKMVAIKLGSPAPGEVSLLVLLAVGSLGAMTVASLTVFDHEHSDLKSTAYCELCILYVGALTSVGSNLNHLKVNSEAAVLLLFILVPFVDVGAFFIGKLFGKLIPFKLAPHVSPNKTIVGGVGGLLGGLCAGVIVWVICEFSPYVNFIYNGDLPLWAVLMLASFLTAILAQLGDLFESAIKRGCGIKDMGKLLPGHGGVLDRFDSMLFATVALAVCFMLINKFAF